LDPVRAGRAGFEDAGARSSFVSGSQVITAVERVTIGPRGEGSLRLADPSNKVRRFSCWRHPSRVELVAIEAKNPTMALAGARKPGRVFRPPGSAGLAFKTERFEMAKQIRTEIGTIPNPVQKIGRGTPLRCFVLGAHSRVHRGLLRPPAVVGTVCELDTLMTGIAVSGRPPLRKGMPSSMTD
jgi:hypothetical protein